MAPGERYGILPRRIPEDLRLPPDARLVAAWLATQQEGFQVVVTALASRLGLGKEKWQRIARQLEATGYLRRSCSPAGERGRWVWTTLFYADASAISAATGADLTGAGFPGDGAPVAGYDGSIRTQRDEEKERTAPPAPAPVDNYEFKDETKPAGKELELIRERLQMTKAQLGTILTACKSSSSRFQDLYQSVQPHLEKHGLRGGKALAYLTACLHENPGRDWTQRQRQEAELEARKAADTAEDQAFASAIQRLAKAGKSGVEVTLSSGGPGCIVLASGGLADVVDASTGKSKGLAQVRQLIAQFPELCDGQ